MLDELCLRAADWAVESFVHWSAPWKIRLKHSFLGFRPALIFSLFRRTAALLFNKIATADEDDSFLHRLISEPVEPVNPVSLKETVLLAMAKADAFFSGKTFGYLLLMTMVAACLLAGKGGRALAVMAAFFCMNWLAEAIGSDYEPVCAGIRQRYLTRVFLRTGAYLALLLDYFVTYAKSGLQINVVLQGAMILTTVIHLICYLSFVAFNQRQQPFLRALQGILGMAPALACAAGAALGASMAAREATLALSGILRAWGAALAFVSWQIEMIDTLGGGRIRFGRLWQGLPMMIGFFMMLGGAWLSAL